MALNPTSNEHKRKSRSGFDLQERRRSLPNQDGQKFRIPASVSKLPPNGTLVNIAYFPGWTQYRGQGRNSCHQRPYLPSSIPWASLDYVMFAFAYFDEDYQLYPADPSDENLYFTINSLKLATNTRVMLSVGGWSFTHPESRRDEDTRHRFHNMVRTAESRKAFIASCIEFCQFYGFDGIDIDYEYPTYNDRESVTALFREMRDAFDREGSGLVLSLAGASFVEGIQGYELDKVSMYTDFLMIMAYDLYTAYDLSRTVNIHTTLVQMPTEVHGGHSVQGAVEYYLDHGVPRQKLVLGMALYGKSFILSDPQQSTPGQAKFINGGDPTRCIETRGDIAFNEIANLIHPSGVQAAQITPLWDSNAKAFYFVYGDHHNWVGYDDRPSLDLKLQMVTELNLAGVMWWSLDQDLDSTSEESAFYKQSHTHHKSKPTAPQAPFQVPPLDAFQANGHLETQTTSSSRDKPKVTPAPAEQEEAFHAQDYPADCPPIGVPPASMTTISPDSLGRPGLVPYVASKKKRCLAEIKDRQALPDTPVGNIVLVRCSGPAGCIDTWQAYTCNPEGWSSPSTCYERDLLSPSLYFYGELELVRAASRDRNVVDSNAGHGLSRASYKLSTQVGPYRPEYITEFLRLAAAMEEKAVQKKAKKEMKEKKVKKEKKKVKADGRSKSSKKKPRRKSTVKSSGKQHV
ncbi:hypothetical protein BGZ70_000270 [Mortierella alpina]|uniref:GH18 domain-containing protein n=1 Tax=Mortierella alpina TaxID=64518 RepID=A0A9P6IYJ1_MORAP|nr:hypothetical protein BGZ70_000270 [Mortierella alpina]